MPRTQKYLDRSGKPFLTREEKREFEGNEFHFENLALEGGGSGAMSYVGVIRVLEELGLLKKFKRFAGSSAGSIVSTFLALGFNSYEIQQQFDRDFSPIMYDGGCGPFGQLLNLVRQMGAHPGRRLERWIRGNIQRKTDNKNITFRQLYDREGIELCILAANLNLMDIDYFHVKTSPDMPIYLAARASSSIPGWYLSMKQEDRFFDRFSDLAKVCEKWTTAERFGTVNEKTLGVMLYSREDQCLMKADMDDRFRQYVGEEVVIPNTKLRRKRVKKKEKNTKAMDGMKEALRRLMVMLNDADIDENGKVSREEFRAFFTEHADPLTDEDIKLIFGTMIRGKNIPDAIFDIIDTDNSGNIEYKEFVELAGKRGVDVAQTIRGYESRHIRGIQGLFTALAETMLLHAQRVTEKSSDFGRTIGIDTGYLGSFDWSMEQADKDFLIQCGKQAALCFLREHMAKSNPTM